MAEPKKWYEGAGEFLLALPARIWAPVAIVLASADHGADTDEAERLRRAQVLTNRSGDPQWGMGNGTSNATLGDPLVAVGTALTITVVIAVVLSALAGSK